MAFIMSFVALLPCLVFSIQLFQHQQIDSIITKLVKEMRMVIISVIWYRL